MSDKWLTVAFGVLVGGFLVLCSVVLFNVAPMKFHLWTLEDNQKGPSVTLNKLDFPQIQGNSFEEYTQESGTEEISTEQYDTQAELVSTEEVNTEEQEVSTEVMQPQNAYYIKVNRLMNCITVYATDEEGNYTIPVRAMACSVGLNGKTPRSTTKITDKYIWRQLYGGVYGQYAVRFNGHVLFHSVPYSSRSKNCLKSSAYNKLGEAASMGCVRLCVADAKWIYDNCDIGTVVEVYESEDPGPLGKPEPIEIDLSSPYKGWDPTDPDPNNPWLTEN